MYIPAIIMVYIVHRTAWPLSPHSRTTLVTGVLITTSLHPDSWWIVRPQLFFTCTVRFPHAKRGPHNKNPEDVPLNLVFFSAFEDLRQRTAGQTELESWVEDLRKLG